MRGWRFYSMRRWGLDPTQTAMLGGVLLVTALVYLRCLANNFVSDDTIIILQNKYIGQWSYLWKSLTRDLWWFNNPKGLSQTSFYQPVQSIWLWVAFHLFGKNPIGWHLIKIALHLGAVTLVFRLAQLLSEDVSVALVAALIFGVLPVHAEAVVWATDIPEPLSSVFDLSVMCLFIQRPKDRYWRGLLAPLLLYTFAAFTHESAVVFPFIIAAYILLFEFENRGNHDEGVSPVSPGHRLAVAIKWSAPFAAVAGAYLLARAIVLGTAGIFGFYARKATAALIQQKVVVHSHVISHPWGEILTTLPSVAIWYLGLLLLPWLPGPGHDANFVKSPTLANFFVPVAALGFMGAAGWLISRKSSRGRLYLFCVIWWLVTTCPAPAPGIKIGADLVYDRYQYMPSFAFCLMLADLAVRLGRATAIRRRIATAVIGTIVAAYSIALWQVEPVWHDNVAMFSHAVARVPESAYYRQALGGSLVRAGDLEGGERQLRYAAKLTPDDSTIHLQLGLLYMRMNRGEEAGRELSAFYRTAFAEQSGRHKNTGPIIIGAPPTAPTASSSPTSAPNK